jgi:hypothetical protein
MQKVKITNKNTHLVKFPLPLRLMALLFVILTFFSFSFVYGYHETLTFYTTSQYSELNMGNLLTSSQSATRLNFGSMPYEFTLNQGGIDKIGYFLYDTSGMNDVASNGFSTKYNTTTTISGSYKGSLRNSFTLDGGSTTSNLSTNILMSDNILITYNTNVSVFYVNQGSSAATKVWLKLLNGNTLIGGCYLGDLDNLGSNNVTQSCILNSTNLNQETQINRVELISQMSSIDTKIRNITFFDLSTTTNQIPNFNITFSGDLCINNSKPTQINVSVSAFDPESDNIYYAKDFTQYKNFNKTIKYSKSDFTGFGIIKDYSSLSNQFNDGSYCEVNLKDSFNISKHNILSFVYDNTQLFDKADYMLTIDNLCTGDSEYIYKLDKAITNLWYYTRIYGFDDSETFYLNFYDSLLNNVASQKFYNNVSNGKIVLYEGYLSNPLNYSRIGEINYVNPVTLSIFQYSNNSKSLLSFVNVVNGVFNVSNILTEKDVKYIGLNTDNRIYQRDFAISGISSSLNFSLTSFSNFIVNVIGTYKLNYYVSDALHYPEEYNKKSFVLDIPDCRYKIESVGQSKTIGEAARDFDLIGLFNLLLGIPFRNYISVFDTNNILPTILFWVYAIIFMGLVIAEYYFSKVADIIFPLGISSLVMLILSILSGVVAVTIVSIIGLSLFAMALFSNAFKGGTNG